MTPLLLKANEDELEAWKVKTKPPDRGGV